MSKIDLKAGWSPSKSAQAAQNYLKNKHNLLSGFESIDDFAVNETALDPKDKRGIEHHLINLRATLARHLWRKEIFVGVSILDMLLFEAVRDNMADYGLEVLERLGKASLSAGFIIFPLHSIGIAQPSIFQPKKNVRFVLFKKAGFAVVAQGNDYDVTIDAISAAMKGLGIKSALDLDMWRHHLQAGNLRWFTRNPLLLVKVTAVTGAYYENQFVYMLKLRLINAMLMMLASFNAVGSKTKDLRTTSRINNWQTLDIHHYLLGEAFKPAKPRARVRIDVRRVPMNLNPVDLAHLSDVPITIDPGALNQAQNKKRLAEIMKTIDAVESGFREHVTLGRNKPTLNTRVYRKLVLSLDWYRRSFSAMARDSEAVVALAVAFETLLSDFYTQGVTAKIIARVGVCLTGNSGAGKYQSAVESLFDKRGKTMHLGGFDGTPDLLLARRAYALCLVKIVSLLPLTVKTTNEPVKALLGV
ncbi:hypothetical protein [Parvibaculum sp.]|uniref:hypothetical protein n=1 Tax=Parvibaculum sp. TaxID=2024848 RepID=UPI00320E6471